MTSSANLLFGKRAASSLAELPSAASESASYSRLTWESKHEFSGNSKVADSFTRLGTYWTIGQVYADGTWMVACMNSKDNKNLFLDRRPTEEAAKQLAAEKDWELKDIRVTGNSF